MNSIDPQIQSLVDVTGELYKRLGVKSVSMDDVARAAGMSKKTLYQLVDNKEDLVALTMRIDFQNDLVIFDRHKRESADAIDEFLRNSRYFIREMREISPATLHDLRKYYPAVWKDTFESHHTAFTTNLTANLERGQEEGLYRHNLDKEVIATLYSGMMGLVIDRQVFPAHDRPLSEVIRQMTEYHFNGIVNPFGRERLEQYLNKESLA